MIRIFAVVVAASVAVGCGGDDGDSAGSSFPSGGSSGSSGVSGSGGLNIGGSSAGSNGGSGGSGAGTSGPIYAELWYTVDQLLVLISLDPADGSVAGIQSSTITLSLDSGQSAITMLNDGSLLASRLGQADDTSHFFHIPSPPRDGSDVSPVDLGVMPGGIMVEGLYTDCDGRLYAMDSGVDDTSSEGNRLLRFTGDVVSGDYTFQVVSDLATADVADIDDMSPGIAGNQITDNPGLAIDTGDIYAFNFETGTGTQIAQAGTFGMHALGGPLFDDDTSRLYVLSSDAELFAIDPVTYGASGVLGTGPTPAQGTPGWSSLAGPLTDCVTGFTPPPQ
jgi:hypothetical protein